MPTRVCADYTTSCSDFSVYCTPALETVAAGFLETSVPIYQTKQRLTLDAITQIFTTVYTSYLAHSNHSLTHPTLHANQGNCMNTQCRHLISNSDSKHRAQEHETEAHVPAPPRSGYGYSSSRWEVTSEHYTARLRVSLQSETFIRIDVLI